MRFSKSAPVKSMSSVNDWLFSKYVGLLFAETDHRVVNLEGSKSKLQHGCFRGPAARSLASPAYMFQKPLRSLQAS